MTVSRDYCSLVCWSGNPILFRLLLIIADIETVNVEVKVGSIIKLYPVILLEEFIYKHFITCAHLIDLNRSISEVRKLFLLCLLPYCGEADCTC